jgi:hypothetical protein
MPWRYKGESGPFRFPMDGEKLFLVTAIVVGAIALVYSLTR